MKTITGRSAIWCVWLWLLLGASFSNAGDLANQSTQRDKVGDKPATNAESDIPKIAKDLRSKGDSLVHGHEYESAIRAFSDAIAVAPSYAEAYLGRAVCYYATCEFEKALADLNKELELKGTDEDVLFKRSQVYMQMGNNDKALVDLDALIKSNGTNAMYYVNRGTCYQRQKQFDQACKDFTRGIQLDPLNPKVYKARSWIYSHDGKIDEAIKDLGECLKLTPDDAQALGWRGDRYYDAGKYSQAENDYYACIRIAPTNHAVLNSLAWTLATCPDAACRDGRKAVELSTMACKLKADDLYVDTLAAAYAEAGDFSEAVICEKKSLDLAKKNGYGEDDSEAGKKSRLSLYENQKAYRDKGGAN